MGLIAFLLAFVGAGPYTLLASRPICQDLDQIGIGPGADRSVTLVPSFQPWLPVQQPAVLAGNDLGLTLAMPATHAVRLTWARSDGTHYLYRNLFDPSDTGSLLILPLAELDDNYFEDRLDLQAGTYFCLLVMLNAASR